MPHGLPVIDLDPFDDDLLSDPYPFYDALRAAGPVVWLSRWNICAVARHAEMHTVLNNSDTFISGRGVGVCDYGRVAPPRPPILILESDAPLHSRLRTVYNRTLSAVAVRTLRAHFTEVAEALVDRLLAKRHIDAVTELAQAYPLSVFPDALGIAKTGRERLLPLADLAFNTHGPDNARRAASIAELSTHYPYMRDACQRENLSPDGFGAKIFEHVDAGDITLDEADGLMRALLTAGMDTTVHALGAAVELLASNPDQWDMLRADPSRARNTFDETVRHASPLQTFARTTDTPTTLGGHAIGAGQKIMMFLASANRDPEKWADPDRFDITRRTGGHVGFGLGPHMCAGQLVARLEGEVLLETLARKVARIEITAPPKRHLNSVLRGWADLPVTLTAA
ncbi:MAG: cytochrome P450 [Pseudomonadota bacterium]|nr:cytochrome P450 [Pseudomonadota bacterium]